MCKGLPFLIFALAAPLAVAAERPLELAQAEPAPSDYVPPGYSRPDPTTVPREPHRTPWLLSVDAALVAKLSTVSPTLPPVGWGAGVSLRRALVHLGPLRFGLGGTFAYQRLQHDKGTTIPFGPSTQYLAESNFAAVLFVDALWGRLRPWLDAGGGFSVAQYYDPAVDIMMPDQRDVRVDAVAGLVQLAAGLAVELGRGVEVGLAGHFDLTFSSRSAGSPERPMPTRYLFSAGLFSTRLQLGFRF